MTRVLFCHAAADRLQAAAAWLWQAATPGGAAGAVIYAPDGRLAERLDQMLWTNPATGFLPHCRARSPLAAETPILIAGTAEELDQIAQDGVLLNLSDDLPPGFGRFAQLVEIHVLQTLVGNDIVENRDILRNGNALILRYVLVPHF